jgi:TRAP-type uncharacterized transport system substrate-binding protein
MKERIFGILEIAMAVFAVLATPVLAAEPNWPATLTVATGSPVGTYHVYGAGLAKILTRALDLPVAAGAPFPAIAELEAKKKITFVEPSEEEILALRLTMPEL